MAVSNDTAERLIQRNRIAPEKVSSIVNGVPLPPILPEDRAAIRAELGIPAGAETIGIVARLAPEKEHRTLLMAFSQLRKSVPKAHLLLVGEGPVRRELERQAVELGIAAGVHFTGFRRDIHRMLAAMDVFVLCSAYEGTSLTLLEAMGARLPVVVTAVAGNREVIGGSECGHLVPARDADALARALVMVLSEPEAARAMAERAHARMKARYGLETMVRRYESLYEDLLGSRSATAV